jgi:hypothetical protein
MQSLKAAFGRIPCPLIALIAVAALMSLAWNISTAPLQGFDESDHVGYVARLAETGSIPSPTAGHGNHGSDEATAMATLGLGPILQNPLAKPNWDQSSIQRFEQFEETLSSADRGAGEGPNGISKNPPLYYAAEAAVWKITPGGLFNRLFMMRLLSGLLLAATVAFTWLLAGELFTTRLPQMVAAAFVAVLPMAGYLGAIINPDIASAAAWTAFLWLALRMIRLGPSAQRAALTTLVAVAAVLTHGRNLPIIPVLMIALITAWAVNRPKAEEMLAGAASAVAVGVGGALVYGLTAARTTAGAFGGEVNLGNSAAFNVRQLASSIWQFYLPTFTNMQPRLGPAYGFRQMFVEQFLGGVFSSSEVVLSYTIYDVVQISFAVLALAFYTVLIRNWRTVLSRWPAVTVIGSAAAAILLFLHLASYRALLGGGSDPLITGRYLLPLVAIFGLALATVIAGLPKRAAPIIAAVLIGALFALSIIALGSSLERFYA